MSISMCEKDGVPSVITTCSASAASATRSESWRPFAPATRSSSSWVPASSKGMRAARTASRRSGSLSTPSTESPRSATASASGRPTRPNPMIETSRGIRGSWRVAAAGPLPGPDPPSGAPPEQARARVLAHEAGDEARVVTQVPPPQPPGLVCESVQPFQPHALHPVRRLGNEAGVEVERRADADQHRRIEPIAKVRHPLLLIGLADAHPHYVGAAAAEVVVEPVGPLV